MVSVHGDEIFHEFMLPAAIGRERRATLKALKCWNMAREDGDIPNLADLTVTRDAAVDEREIFTGNQFLIMFEPDTSNSVVIYYGADLPNLLNPSQAGCSMRESLPPSLKDIFQDACMEAVKTSDVVYRHGAITAPTGDSVLYRSIFMPLRTNSHSDRIYIFGAFSNEIGSSELLAAA